MTERFLFYLWQFRLFNQDSLRTSTGEELQILKPGELNSHAGPDFRNALLKLGNTIWAGNVEIHIKASDWDLHKHTGDENYDNIILHVVLDSDRIIHRKSGEPIPCLELKNRVDWTMWDHYKQLLQSRQWIPCSNDFSQANESLRSFWLQRLTINRMERKALEVEISLKLNNNNLEEAFYWLLARNFGFHVNGVPFELMAKSLPWLVIAKHRNSLFQLEALVFGQAGLLEDALKDEYYLNLQKEYRFLQHKFDLHPIQGHVWKFLRLRPGNFPTLRLAQFAAVLHQSDRLLSQMVHSESLAEISQVFKVKPSEYWKTHYRFGKLSKTPGNQLGEAAIQSILINSVVPMLFLVNKQHLGQRLQEKALRLLEQTPEENNEVSRGFESIGFKPNNAFDSQALLELKSEFCDKRRCLDCGIGAALLNPNPNNLSDACKTVE